MMCLATAGAIAIVLMPLGVAGPMAHHPPRAMLESGLRSFLRYLPIMFVLEEVSFRGALDSHVHHPGEPHGILSATFVSALWGLWHYPIASHAAPLDKKKYSKPAFDKLNAYGRIRELLKALRIPRGVPPRYAALAAWATKQKPKDGPETISRLRNKLVHPDPPARKVLEATTARVRRQATWLTLWYIELALLALCRYQGKYVTRIYRPGSSRDAATVMVPWRLPKRVGGKAGRP